MVNWSGGKRVSTTHQLAGMESSSKDMQACEDGVDDLR